jgi:hypothetical protein
MNVTEDMGLKHSWLIIYLVFFKKSAISAAIRYSEMRPVSGRAFKEEIPVFRET